MVSAGDGNLWGGTLSVLIMELSGVQTDQIEVPCRESAQSREREMIRPLRGHQPLAVHNKFVAFRFTAENGMVFENQTLQLGISLLKQKCGRQTTDATAHNHTVEDFTRIDHLRRSLDEHIVADLMAGIDDLVGVPVGMSIIAHTSIACPRVGCQ